MVLEWAGRRWEPSALRPGRTSAAEEGPSPTAATQRGERHLGHRDPGTRRHSHRRIQRGGIGVVSVGGHCSAARLALTASKQESRSAVTHPESPGEQHRPARDARSTLGRIWGGQSPAPGNRHRQSLSATAPEDEPLTASKQARGCFHWWWQVMGSNHRRLSRRFYSEPIPAHRNSH